ncbi:hypothetical protein FA13DRAFT_1083980 [Coprinellus micaceus]|uniref:Uncharacterized protein n=1 Tax=Coprinellus micaceus TaxID=71717 RepID=A0A4Y7TSA3_COPMI|nr:hypothetical protein FA13DRAFT_1083980 [Coprinellus micaceus]
MCILVTVSAETAIGDPYDFPNVARCTLTPPRKPRGGEHRPQGTRSAPRFGVSLLRRPSSPLLRSTTTKARPVEPLRLAQIRFPSSALASAFALDYPRRTQHATATMQFDSVIPFISWLLRRFVRSHRIALPTRYAFRDHESRRLWGARRDANGKSLGRCRQQGAP